MTTVQPTSLTLLQQAKAGSDDAWQRMDRLYRPFIHRWLTGQGLADADADDLTQEVMLFVSRELETFEHNGRAGAFRTWLRNICLNRVLGFRRAQKNKTAAVGGTDFQALLAELPSEDEMQRRWDREHDTYVLGQLLQQITCRFEPATIEAFRRSALQGQPAAQVASELGIAASSVYLARSRIMRQLRREAEGLVDQSRFNVE